MIDQPFANHNGGDIEWGPDDMLWIGTGDGGAADDPDGRAQRLSDPLGKILRLDPSLEGIWKRPRAFLTTPMPTAPTVPAATPSPWCGPRRANP